MLWTAAYQTLLAGFRLYLAMAHAHDTIDGLLRLYGFLVLPPFVMVILASYAYERLQRTTFMTNYLLEIERARSESILRNTLPDPIVDRLKASGDLIADDYVEVTVLFADIAGFTPWSAERSAWCWAA